MMKGQNIVCFANDWNSDPTSKHHVMRLLAKENRILWINSIGMRAPSPNRKDLGRIYAKLKAFLSGPRQVLDNLFVVSPLVLPFYRFRIVRRLNAALLAAYIRWHTRRLGMRELQVWTFLPTMSDLAGRLGEKFLVYYCVDDWAEFSFLNRKMIGEMEADLVRKSDVVIVSAEALYERIKPQQSRTYLVTHGVDGEHFARALTPETRLPADMEELPRPIIGFWGAIHEWVDLDLIEKVAAAHPEWSVVLIGKDETDSTLLRRCRNVHLVGQRRYEILPAYAKAFSVAILPFKVNRLTASVNPIKLREYLAAGLPVVSTNLPEVMAYKDVVRVAKDHEEFLSQLEKALGHNDPEAVKKRLEYVKGETWEAKVEAISQILEGEMARHAPLKNETAPAAIGLVQRMRP